MNKKTIHMKKSIWIFVLSISLCANSFVFASESDGDVMRLEDILNSSQNQETEAEVESLEISNDNCAIRYLGYDYVPEDFYMMGISGDASKTISINFEYTNKTKEAKNVQNDFFITVEQNGEKLPYPSAWNADIDTTAFLNLLNGLANNETIPVSYIAVIKDYSPLTITVSTTQNGETTTEVLEQKIDPPGDAILAGEMIAPIEELETDWINIDNGDVLAISDGVAVDDTENSYKGDASLSYMDNTRGVSGRDYSFFLEGDLITIDEEHFRIIKDNDKIYLKSEEQDITYIRREDLYRFEDLELHHIGDSVSTDAVEFCLKDYGYMDSVSRSAIGAGAQRFDTDDIVPENGMIFAKIFYNLKNISNTTISQTSVRTNVRFFIVYNQSFVFDMESFNSWIIKGYGGNDHVEWLGSTYGDGPMDLKPLVNEDFDVYIPIASEVRDDMTSPLHMIVLLPSKAGTKIFAFDLRSNSDNSDMESQNESSQFTGLSEDFSNEAKPNAENENEDNIVYSDAETIKSVQEKLNQLGYDCGTPDGDKGPKTISVIQQYQTDNDLEATGEIDDALLKSLGIQ